MPPISLVHAQVIARMGRGASASNLSRMVTVAGERLSSALSAPRLKPVVAGVLVTTKKDVLDEAKPVDDGIQSLRLDMARQFYSHPDQEWSKGCATGFDDAYVRGYYGLGGIAEPSGTPAYVAAYRSAFSLGSGYPMGQAAKARGDSTANADTNEDPSILAQERAKCNVAFSDWIAKNPQAAPPANIADEDAFRTDFLNFTRRWEWFYTSLYDLGVLDSGDAAIEATREYYKEYLAYVNRFKSLGFSVSYVPPEPLPPKTLGQSIGNVVSSVPWTGLAIAGLGAGALVLWLSSRKTTVQVGAR